MRLRFGAATSAGRIRERNEDVYLVRAAQGLFVVCDGMGGAPAGEVASEIAAATILSELDGALSVSDSPRQGSDAYLPQTTRLAEAVQRSNQVIYDQGLRDPAQAQMGTTVVGVWLTGNVASVAHVGDSRAYLWRATRLEPLTRDHSVLEALIRGGMQDSADTLPADEQNSLVRVLGGEPDVDVELNELPVRAGDYLLLCSDGLTRMVPEPQLGNTISALRDPQQICDALIDAANRNGGADNVTVVVVHVAGTWWQRLSSRWSPIVRGAHDAKAHPEI
jgi:PPM family protein phosphatase